ncbi:baseplate assembly protein [Thalassospira marina]|uniref:Baseplate assembly protein n=1 Tax=Thalassospira marina TaxID=2048283 RepID=A0A2N3KX52_9PROT|nr:baseplate J/gp47 family protein [Thalassospira marina]PKR55056.1 baseplate assembly protein [Thalassospira marina]
MTTRFDAINLGALSAPDIVKTINFETILAERKAKAKALFDAAGILPDWDPELESDPVVKLLEEAALREVILRQRINDAARACMIATATKADLDNIGARYHVVRQVITAADDSAVPPVPAVVEKDEAFRIRILLAFEALSTAGPIGAYKYHSLSAHPDVYDVDIASPEPGVVIVTVMSNSNNGIPTNEVVAAVDNALNDEDVRPLTDRVSAKAATTINYDVRVFLQVYSGPDAEVVRKASETSLNTFIISQRKLGEPVTIDGLHKAARVDGVRKAIIYYGDGTTPFTDIEPANDQFAFCIGLTVTVLEAA